MDENFLNYLAFATTSLFFYTLAAISGESLNFTKWKENRMKYIKQINLEEEIQQNTYRQEFQSLDKNKDYLVDSIEFIYRE